MIIGEFSQKIGDKNRIAFPKKFREELKNKLVITKGYEKCLIIVSPAQWDEIISDSVSGSFVSGLIRDTRRFLLASASEIELDAQGRFVIPPYLKEYASLQTEGVFLGLGKWVELWDQTKWIQKRKEVEDESSEIAERLAHLKNV